MLREGYKSKRQSTFLTLNKVDSLTPTNLNQFGESWVSLSGRNLIQDFPKNFEDKNLDTSVMPSAIRSGNTTNRSEGLLSPPKSSPVQNGETQVTQRHVKGFDKEFFNRNVQTSSPDIRDPVEKMRKTSVSLVNVLKMTRGNKSDGQAELSETLRRQRRKSIALQKKRQLAANKAQKERAEFFGVDQNNEEQDLLRVKESDIVFRYKQFFEFLFYHIVFFFFLGPLSFIILYPIAGKLLTKNMGFAGLNTMFINQSIQWALLFSSAFLWIYTDHGPISSVEVYMIASAVFLRICTISSKYGSMHPVRLRVLKTQYLTYDQLTQDYMLMKWRDQTDDVIEQELVAAIKRHDIDTSLFFFNFLADIDEDTRKKLTQIRSPVVETTKKLVATEFLRGQSQDSKKSPADDEEEIEDISEGGVTLRNLTLAPSRLSHIAASSYLDFPCDGSFERHNAHVFSKLDKKDETINQQQEQQQKKKKQNLLNATLNNQKTFDMLSGVNLAREVIFEAKKRSIPQIFVLALSLGLVRGVIPLVYRVLNGEKPFGDSGHQVYMASSYILCNMYFFGANLAFVLVGLSDLRKKFYLMTQLSNLLSARKMEQYESKKIYPTINIFDPFSLRSWISLRKIFMDFGRKYFLRINLNISIFLFFYIVILAILLLKFFGIMTIIQDDLLSFVFLFEVLLMFGLIIRSIIVGAYINDHFRVHRSILHKNKTVVSDLLQLDDIYFPIIENNFRPANVLYQEGVRKIKSLVKLAGLEPQSKESGRAIEDYLSKLIEFNDNAIEELQFDSINKPVKILGFETNNNLVRQIFVGLFTVGVAIAQKALDSGDVKEETIT